MATPLERNTVLPKEWGARVNSDVPWADDYSYKPTVHIIHYNGGAVPAGVAPYSIEAEMAWLRAAESWHLNPNRAYGPMRAIAYNKAIGMTGTLYDGRTDRHRNGGQFEPWNSRSRAVVFILGGDQQPSKAARVTFGRLWLEQPLDGTVMGHSDVGQTACPGDWLRAWKDRKGWIEDLGVWSQGDSNVIVGSAKVRLHRLGYRLFPSFGPKFTPGFRRQVQRFQKRHGLTMDGVLGPQTFAAMGGLTGEVFPDDHSGEPA